MSRSSRQTPSSKKTTTLTDFKDAGVITIWNLQGTDGGAAGIKIDDVVYPSINAGRGENPGENSVSFFTHEMLHSLGIKHARGPASAETVPLQLKADSTKDHTFGKNLAEEYGDCWTIMGCGSSVIWTGDEWGHAGPGLGAAHRYQLGWLPSSRVFLFTGPTTTLSLAPSNRPDVAGHLLARIPVNATGPCCDFYTVEYIERSGWNEKIEMEKAVLIHEIRQSVPGHTYLLSRSVWGAWVPGQVFTDSANRIRISIDSYGDAAKVTISSGGEPDDGSAKCGFTGYKDNTRSKTAPSVKIESPLNNSHVVAGFPVTMRVAAFDPTIDSGTPSAAPAPDKHIHWRLGSGVTKDGRSFTHTFPDPGDRKIEVSVENAYCQSTTKTALFSIDPPPAATVVILEPVDGQEYLVGPPDFAQTITLTGSGSSSIVKYEWIDSTSTGVMGSGETLTATVPLRTTTHNCAVEPHVITLRGTTSTGEIATASVTITLKTNCIR